MLFTWQLFNLLYCLFKTQGWSQIATFNILEYAEERFWQGILTSWIPCWLPGNFIVTTRIQEVAAFKSLQEKSQDCKAPTPHTLWRQMCIWSISAYRSSFFLSSLQDSDGEKSDDLVVDVSNEVSSKAHDFQMAYDVAVT